MRQSRGNPMTCTLPHPDHFDASKFGPNGERLCNGKPGPKGKPSRLKLEDVEQLLFLELLATTTARDLLEWLEAKGFDTKAKRTKVLADLHKGWRPQR